MTVLDIPVTAHVKFGGELWAGWHQYGSKDQIEKHPERASSHQQESVAQGATGVDERKQVSHILGHVQSFQAKKEPYKSDSDILFFQRWRFYKKVISN